MPDYLARFIPGTSPNRKGFRERGEWFFAKVTVSPKFSDPQGHQMVARGAARNERTPWNLTTQRQAPRQGSENSSGCKEDGQCFIRTLLPPLLGGVMFWGIYQGFPHPSVTPGYHLLTLRVVEPRTSTSVIATAN